MRVATADDPRTEFATAREEGEIRVEKVTLGAKLKLGLTRLAGSVVDVLEDGIG